MSERITQGQILIADGLLDPTDGLAYKIDYEPEVPLIENWVRCNVDVEINKINVNKSEHREEI